MRMICLDFSSRRRRRARRDPRVRTGYHLLHPHIAFSGDGLARYFVRLSRIFQFGGRAILRRMCQQRPALSCINTVRCSELPPDDAASQEFQNPGPALPPIPGRRWARRRFRRPASPRHRRRRQAGFRRRASFISSWGCPSDGKPVTHSRCGSIATPARCPSTK